MLTTDHEMMVKTYSVSPSMLGRGHILLEPGGPVWVRLYQLMRSLCCHSDNSLSLSLVRIIIRMPHSALPMGCYTPLTR
jgi:hypothetical protein